MDPQLDNPKPAPRMLLLVPADEVALRIGELREAAFGTAAAGPGALDFIRVGLASGEVLDVLVLGNADSAVEVLSHRPVDAVVVDNRGFSRGGPFSATLAGQVLPTLLALAEAGRLLSRRTILVVLPEGQAVAQHAYAVGTLQLGGIIVGPENTLAALAAARRSVEPAELGKVALCLAGGGIEGMLYELGVVMALDACLDGTSVIDFDIVSGISAGALLGAFLVNGVRPREMYDMMHGRPSRVGQMTRAMMFDPNFAEVTTRMLGAASKVVRGKFLKRPIDTAMSVAPTALFAGDKIRWYLEQELTKPGLTNDFNQLKKQFFVGVTDQDLGHHVTFGVDGTRDVPISHAVRASAAMTPYYPPEKIKGRYYIDGIFTRTINLDVAVAHGARLIICVDPLRPVESEQAGYVSDRGGVFNTVQSVKAMIRTRLSEVIERAEGAYPDVPVFVFSPTPRDMEQLSGTMMRFFYNTKSMDLAFKSASEQIARDFEWLEAAFRRHGIKLKRPAPE